MITQGSPRFSILTSVYDTKPQFLREAAESVFKQTYGNYEWIICDNGSTKAEVVGTIGRIAENSQVNVMRLESNQGIIGGVRNCLSRASADYVVPMDSDDLLDPEALSIFADTILERNYPAFIYSDEDLLINGEARYPYRRPDWDPVLNICTSYIWHLTAFRLDHARKLGVYEDDAACYCHDWDTVMRFRSAGLEIQHIPRTLYHWRSHEESSTNKSEADAGSLQSQRHVLERELDRMCLSELFEICFFPISRGTPEWWVRRKEEQPEAIHLVLGRADAGSAIERESGYPFSSEFNIENNTVLTGSMLRHLEAASGASNAESGLVAFISGKILPQGRVWPWEAIGLRRMHPDTAMFSCRILDEDQKVVGGGEFVDGNGTVRRPYYGLAADNPGYYALALKQQSVSGVSPEFFIVDLSFVKKALAAMPPALEWESLAERLAERARESGKRFIFTPLISGKTAPHTGQEKELFGNGASSNV
jgi:O-antigen biosynthesis protein